MSSQFGAEIEERDNRPSRAASSSRCDDGWALCLLPAAAIARSICLAATAAAAVHLSVLSAASIIAACVTAEQRGVKRVLMQRSQSSSSSARVCV